VVMTRACSIGTVVALLAVGAFVASPLRYRSPRRAAAVPTHTNRSLHVGGRIVLDHANPVAHLHNRQELSSRRILVRSPMRESGQHGRHL
jgi:hypothetical protein